MNYYSIRMWAYELLPGYFVVLNEDQPDVGYRIDDIVQKFDDVTLIGENWKLTLKEHQKISVLLPEIIKQYKGNGKAVKVKIDYPDFMNCSISISEEASESSILKYLGFNRYF